MKTRWRLQCSRAGMNILSAVALAAAASLDPRSFEVRDYTAGLQRPRRMPNISAAFGRAFGRAFRSSPRGSFWKPGAEHLPTGGPSRQEIRRRKHVQARAAAREKVHNVGLPSPWVKPKRIKPGHEARTYVGTVWGKRVEVDAISMSQARRKLREDHGQLETKVAIG